MTDTKEAPEIIRNLEITIHWDGRVSKYVIPTVPHENTDAMSSLVAALVDLEQRVCELETARWEGY